MTLSMLMQSQRLLAMKMHSQWENMMYLKKCSSDARLQRMACKKPGTVDTHQMAERDQAVKARSRSASKRKTQAVIAMSPTWAARLW